MEKLLKTGLPATRFISQYTACSVPPDPVRILIENVAEEGGRPVPEKVMVSVPCAKLPFGVVRLVNVWVTV